MDHVHVRIVVSFVYKTTRSRFTCDTRGVPAFKFEQSLTFAKVELERLSPLSTRIKLRPIC
jgi:hypothetical protein